MIDEEPDIRDLDTFDVTDAKIEYHRNRETTRVTMTIKDVRGISELKLYLLLALEVEKLERRLGIHPEIEDKH